jgi:hypothetical protein
LLQREAGITPDRYWKKRSLDTLKLTVRGPFLRAALNASFEDSTLLLPGYSSLKIFDARSSLQTYFVPTKG